jgi:hypothetical protein
MFKFDEIESAQIEITNRCQARCPMCLRNVHGGIENKYLKPNDWSFDDFKIIFTPEILHKLKRIDFCGDYGEPILNQDIILMCRYIRDINPEIFVAIFTNGSARTVQWWKTLASALPKNHKVEFALDGLEDIHSLYRIGTDFNKIIRNAKSFISAGGIAVWMFIKFRHNEHQIEAARKLASDCGFNDFLTKNSKRFGKTFKVLDRDGNFSHSLDQPLTSPIKFVKKEEILNFQNWKRSGDIDCFVLHRKEIYIDAHFTTLPCCLLGAFLYANYDKDLYEKYDVYSDSSIIDAGYIAKTETYRIVNDLGGLASLNAKNGLKNIINSVAWQEIWYKEWKNKSSPVCILLCSKDTPITKIDDQIDNSFTIKENNVPI